MKKYLILLLLSFCFSCKAQETIPMSQDYTDYLKNNNYIKDTNNDLDKFVGTWKWINPANPNTYFEINFFKVTYWNPNNKNKYFIDKIIGNYRYVENGIIITNTLNNNNYDLNSTLFPNILSNCFAPSFMDLLINMRDVAKNKNCKADFKIINLTAPVLTATWKISYVEGWRITPVQQGFSIPTDIVLTKQ